MTIFHNKSQLVSDLITTHTGQKIVNFAMKDGEIYTKIGEHVVRLEKGHVIQGDECFLLAIEECEPETYSLEGIDMLVFGSSKIATVQMDIKEKARIVVMNEERGLVLYPHPEQRVYVNNIPLKEEYVLHPGDMVDIAGTEFIFRRQTLEARSYAKTLKAVQLIPVEMEEGLRLQNVEYKRSPRLIFNEPTDDITISTPPGKVKQDTGGLIKLIIPPLVMAGVTVGIRSTMSSNNPIIYISLVTAIMTVIMSIWSYIKQNKDRKAKNENRVVVYTEYLKRKIIDIQKRAQEQAYALHYHYPTSETILTMLEHASPRLYEKTTLSHDFLEIRIGRANIPLSFSVNFDEKDFLEEEDVLIDEAKNIRDRFKRTTELPRTLHLSRGAIGLLGQPQLMMEQVALLIHQISFFHSYHDVEIIHVFKEEELPFWKQYDFLPHSNSKLLHARTNIYSERTRDQILSSVYQLLKERHTSFDEKKHSGASLTFTPHIVLIVSDMKQIIDHAIMEYLSYDVSHLGISVVYVDRTMKNLPEHAQTVVEYKNTTEGRIVTEEGKLVNERIILDHLQGDYPFERLPRILAGYEHVQTLQSSIPENVSFLQMYEATEVSELHIKDRWSHGEPGKTLAVPLGYRGPKDIVYLNLHEKAHGPHGLIAGTTGSGKSEIVQSYILSLAVNFHPHDVGFLLIDYKGGGMANLFKDLPHLLGTITNLDGASSMRALISIKAELLRRQQRFSENDVNHIDGYQKLYKEGKVSEPMPHLFMISDEFAELKAEQPEFMKELVSTARIGRSLGIHLILATQKPSGVVDDQIWSNSKFKLCLKVQNESDSKEMLKTPDAASIIQPGRAYLQVGNNEIYELFQSAYSGAPYLAGQVEEDVRDHRIYEITPLGQLELKTQDLSKGHLKVTQNELEAVIEGIAALAKEEKIEPVARPWLPPLSEEIYREELRKQVKEEKEEPLEIIVGLTDEPQHQSQRPLYINLSNSNLAVFGLSGYGKTTFMQTALSELFERHTPEELHAYILDFGGGLLPFQKFPHVGELMTIDEDEKITKFANRILEEMKNRKRQFKHAGVGDIHTYFQVTGKKLPSIFVVFDNYDALKDSDFGADFDKVVVQVAREGLSLGIHVILTASRISVLRYNLLANFKEKLTFYVTDKNDITATVGRTDIAIDEIPGRGIISLDTPTLFQTALPIKGSTAAKRLQALRLRGEELTVNFKGERPKGIPVIPESLTLQDFKKTYLTSKSTNPLNVAIGLTLEAVTPVYLDLSTEYVTMGLHKDTRKRMIQTIMETSGKNVKYGLIDTARRELQQFKNQLTYVHTKEELEVFLTSLYAEGVRRQEALTKLQETKIEATYESVPKATPIIVFINEPDTLPERQNDTKKEQQFAEFITMGCAVGITFITFQEPTEVGILKERYRIVSKQSKCSIIEGKIGDSKVTVTKRTYNEPIPTKGQVNVVKEGNFELIKVVDE